jgi:hypothetical protein
MLTTVNSDYSFGTKDLFIDMYTSQTLFSAVESWRREYAMTSVLGGWRGKSCTTGDAFTGTKRVSTHASRVLRAAGME